MSNSNNSGRVKAAMEKKKELKRKKDLKNNGIYPELIGAFNPLKEQFAILTSVMSNLKGQIDAEPDEKIRKEKEDAYVAHVYTFKELNKQMKDLSRRVSECKDLTYSKTDDTLLAGSITMEFNSVIESFNILQGNLELMFTPTEEKKS